MSKPTREDVERQVKFAHDYKDTTLAKGDDAIIVALADERDELLALLREYPMRGDIETWLDRRRSALAKYAKVTP